jgi:predicted nucleotidyltransferase
MSAFTAPQEEAIRSLVHACGEDGVLLIGGGALRAHVGMPWRTTLDIDFLAWTDPVSLVRKLERLGDWRHVSEQRWTFRTSVLVDILPVSNDVLSEGVLAWPSGSTMSTQGMLLARATAMSTRLSDGTAVFVGSLPALALLKMASFLDRPIDRQRDLADIDWLLREFVSDGADPRRFDLRFGELRIEYMETPAFILGQALRHSAGPEDEHLLRRFLDEVRARWLDRMAREGMSDRAGVQARLRALEIGYGTAV